MSECKLEVGRTYITKRGDQVEVVSRLTRPLFSSRAFGVIFTYKDSEYEVFRSYCEDGRYLGEEPSQEDIDFAASEVTE